MSRIHDALKKAEQEKVDPANGPAWDEEALPPVLDQQTAIPTADQNMPVFAAAISEDPQRPLTSEVLLQACAFRSWEPNRERLLFCNSHNHPEGSEEFRTLRTRLYQLRQKQELHCVLISSPIARDGKTFVAANLAQVIVRQHGRRALLIDADLRRSQLHTLIGAPLVPGLAEYLRGEADECAVIQHGPVENLFFIPGGNPVANPTELLANGRLKMLLRRVGAAFDWVIVDSPPVVPVSDAHMLADVCDGVLLVLKAAVTPLEMAQKAQQEFRAKNLLGVVLNCAEPGSTYGKYYYSPAEGDSSDKKNTEQSKRRAKGKVEAN